MGIADILPLSTLIIGEGLPGLPGQKADFINKGVALQEHEKGNEEHQDQVEEEVGEGFDQSYGIGLAYMKALARVNTVWTMDSNLICSGGKGKVRV